MKRILYISQYLNRNGTEAFMMNVVRHLHSDDLVFDFLLYGSADGGYQKEVESYGGHLTFVPSRRQSPLGWYSSLYRFFKQYSKEYVAIHFCGNSLTSIASLFFAWRFHVPVRIVHAHNSSARGFHNKLLHILKRGLAYHLTTHHLACSTKAAYWFFGKKDSIIIKNGIDVDWFRFNPLLRQSVRERLHIGSDELVLGHVGRFVEEKNHTFLLDVFSELLNAQPASHLLLVGDGPLKDTIKSKAETLEIADRVHFLGVRTDVNELMQAMDVFVMPSIFEGLPFVLIEAQCAGLPCCIADTINSDICITADVHRMALSLSPKEWAKNIITSLINERSSGYQKIVESGYDIQTTIFQLKDIYRYENCY